MQREHNEPPTWHQTKVQTYTPVSPAETKLSVLKFRFGRRNAANHFQTELKSFLHYSIQVLWWAEAGVYVYACVCLCVNTFVCVCVCVHCLVGSDRYVCVTDYNNIQFGRLWAFPASSTDAQHPPEVAWVVIHDAAARGVCQQDILPHWGGLTHVDVGKMTMPAYRSQSLDSFKQLSLAWVMNIRY